MEIGSDSIKSGLLYLITFSYFIVAQSKPLSKSSKPLNFFLSGLERLMMIAAIAGERDRALIDDIATAKEIVKANC